LSTLSIYGHDVTMLKQAFPNQASRTNHLQLSWLPTNQDLCQNVSHLLLRVNFMSRLCCFFRC